MLLRTTEAADGLNEMPTMETNTKQPMSKVYAERPQSQNNLRQGPKAAAESKSETGPFHHRRREQRE